MNATTQITNIAELLNVSDYAGEFATDYDLDAVRDDVVVALDEMAGAGVYVTRSGDVYADVDEAERAREIDWRELSDHIDMNAIFVRHEVPA